MKELYIIVIMYVIYFIALYEIDAKKYINPFITMLLMGRPKGVYKIVRTMRKVKKGAKFIEDTNAQTRCLLFYNGGKNMAYFDSSVIIFTCMMGTYKSENMTLKLGKKNGEYFLISDGEDGSQVKLIIEPNIVDVPRGTYHMTASKSTPLTPLGLTIGYSEYTIEKYGLSMTLSKEKSYYIDEKKKFYMFPYGTSVGVNNADAYAMILLILGDNVEHITYMAETI